MSQSSKHKGVVVPMVTPFDSEGRLDRVAAEALCDRLARNGMGIFVLGTTGEASSIRHEERMALVDIAVNTAKGRVLVYAGIGDNCVSASVDAGLDYLTMGVDGVVSHLPSYYLLNSDEMQAYFELLARELRRNVLIYNMPQTTRMSIPLEVIEKLSTRPEIIGYKDSENIPNRPEDCARLLAGRSDFSIFMGVAMLSSKALRLGFDGLVPSSGNLVPELWNDFNQKALAEEWDKVDDLQKQVDRVAQVFQRNRSLAQSLGALKAAVHALGLCSPTMLPPLATLSEKEITVVAEELRGLLRPSALRGASV